MNWGIKVIKMVASPLGPSTQAELPLFLTVTPRFVCPDCTFSVPHPFACCFSRRWEGSAFSSPWSPLVSGSGTGHAPRRLAGLGFRDVGNRTQDHICKSNKVESWAGQAGCSCLHWGKRWPQRCLPPPLARKGDCLRLLLMKNI